VLLRHLALAVTDEQRSRSFYERWFGFSESRRMDGYVVEAAWDV
jgi:catechol 2,3-dioxygenase-like lactoylglutathione lyase family enzyme